LQLIAQKILNNYSDLPTLIPAPDVNSSASASFIALAAFNIAENETLALK
jgi:hypothetical protein